MLSDLGDWSYAFYLSHMLVLMALERIMPLAADVLRNAGGVGGSLANMLPLGAPGPLDNIIFLVAGLALSTLVSWGAFSLFERPMLRIFGRVRSALFSPTHNQLRPRPIRAGIW